MSTKESGTAAAPVLPGLDAPLLVVDDSGRVTHCSAGVSQLLGYPDGELVGSPLERLGAAAAGEPLLRQALGDRDRAQWLHTELTRADGEPAALLVSAVPVGGADGGRSTVLVLAQPDSAEHDLATRARQAGAQAMLASLGLAAARGAPLSEVWEEAWRVLTQLAVPAALFVVLADGADVILVASHRPHGCAPERFAVLRAEVLAEAHAVLVTGGGSPSSRPGLVMLHGSAGPIGMLRACALEGSDLGTADLVLLQAVGNLLAAVVDREARGRELLRVARFDDVTGLVNRTEFLRELDAALRAEPATTHVLCVDLDGYKLINDGLGHKVGDDVLREVARRLSAVAGAPTVVGRLGGDEFGLLLRGTARPDASRRLATRIQGAFREPYRAEGIETAVSVSVGLAHGGRGMTATEMLSCADVAMYEAKQRGGGSIEEYTEPLRQRRITRLTLGDDLRRALDADDQLRVEYQPELDLSTGTVVWCEALARWHHPTRGRVPPSVFLPIAEAAGLIAPLGRRVLEQVCSDLVRWRARGQLLAALPVAVNVSPRELGDGRFARQLLHVIDQVGVDPSWLWLELTEHAVLADEESASYDLMALKDAGFRVAIDDFGTGHSSLSWLRRLRADALKIDRTFISGLGESIRDRTLTSLIITLAHNLEAHTVAEGVETRAQAAELRALGCDYGQGNLWSRSVPADQVAGVVEALNRAEQPHTGP